MEILSTDIKKLKRHKVYQRVVEKVINYLERNYSKRIFLEDISKTVKLSQEYLSRIFKFQTGMTIFDYLIKIRIEKSQEFLKDVKYNIKEISNMVGYPDVSYFCRLFKKHTKLTPTEYRMK